MYGFNSLITFVFSLNNNNYLIDHWLAIFQFDSKWNYVTKISKFYPYAFLFVNNLTIYLTDYNGIYKVDTNWNVQQFYFNSANYYQKLIYNTTADHLLVTSGTSTQIDVFDQSLNFLKSINIQYIANDIKEFNSMFFVATNSSYVLVLQNNAIKTSFWTLCSSINSLLIDSNGLLALLCSNIIFVYNWDGQYMNITWTSLVPNPIDISFDAYGNFAITAPNGVFLLNIQETTVQLNLTLDDTCTGSNSKHVYEIFKNPKIQMQITSTSSFQSSFKTAKSFLSTCESNYVLDDSKNEIVKYDKNWNYENNYSPSVYSNPRALISLLEANKTRIFYYSTSFGIYKLDENFNIISAYLSIKYNSFTRIRYNAATNHIIAVSTSFNGFFIFDTDLTLIKYCSIQGAASSTDIEVFNNRLYVSTSNGIVWIVYNETLSIYQFINTTCSSIRSLLIDGQFPSITIMCSDSDVIHLYNPFFTNRGCCSYMSFVRINLVNLVPFPVDIGFDSKGNYVITGKNGVYLLNTPQSNTMAVDATLDNFCINKSKRIFFFFFDSFLNFFC